MPRPAPDLTQAIARLNQATASLDPPLAALDLPSLRDNLDDLARRAAGKPVRVASKSVRCRAVLDLALRHPAFAGVMAYSLQEAIWLARHGTSDDILVGYPTVDRAALAELAGDAGLRQTITLMVDSAEQCDLLAGAPIQVCLDVDASLRLGPLHLGVRRSPLHTPAEVVAVASHAEKQGLHVAGVMFYEAQIAGVPDSNVPVRLMKKASGAELRRRRGAVVDAVTAVLGRPLRFVNGGGTGSLELTGADPAVTELTAGSGLFTPTLFDNYRAFAPRPALFFALPVVRRPAPGISTLLYGGYIASGPTGTSRQPTIASPPGATFLRAEGAGEVQSPITGDLELGDRAWLRHAKAGELCERFNNVVLVDEDSSVSTPTYRGEGQCFG